MRRAPATEIDNAATPARIVGSMLCDVETLSLVLARLESCSVVTWIFGGWAEELRGLTAERLHSDIDLLYPCSDFLLLDAVIRRDELDEIIAKRSSHKRAIVLDGVMTEIFLMRSDSHGAYTHFWDRIRHDWPADVLDCVAGLRVASASALQSYRAAHAAIHVTDIPTAKDRTEPARGPEGDGFALP